MNTISDLRRSLDESAHHHDSPDPHELLRAVQDDIATGADKRNRKPRLVAAAAAIALVTGGGWALTQGMGDDDETGTMQPADQVWDLVDGSPPEYAEGLTLVDTVTLSTVSSTDELIWAGLGQGYAVLWCDVAPAAADTLAVAVSTGPGLGTAVGCTNVDGSSPGGPLALQTLGNGQGLAAEIRGPDWARASGLEGRATAVIGLYREAAPAEFPYPEQQALPEPPTHDVVINASSPMTSQSELADLTGQGVMYPAATVESRAGTTLTTWSGEPGRLMVAVNGTVVTNDGEGLSQPAGAGRWQDADPDLRAGYWHTWTSGASTRKFDLSPAGLAAHGIQVEEGDTVVVAATGAFPRDAWQVGIDYTGEPGGSTADSAFPESMRAH